MTWAVGARLHTTTCSVFCGLRCTLLIDCSAPLATCGGLQNENSTTCLAICRHGYDKDSLKRERDQKATYLKMVMQSQLFASHTRTVASEDALMT